MSSKEKQILGRSRWSSRRPWIERAAFVVLLAAAFFAGTRCSGSGPDVIPESLAIHLDAPGRYVALGDSYSAGEGLPTYTGDTVDVSDGGDRCHRSEEWGYPVLLKFAEEPEERTLRACSGAVTANVFNTVQLHDHTPNSQGHQIEAGILGADVAFVTLTMGGNDLHFADILSKCAIPVTCMDDPYSGAPTLFQWIEDQLEALSPQLVKVYADIRKAIPADTRFLVIGYPALFPEGDPAPFDATCRLLLSRWGPSEREAIRGFLVELNDRIRAAAEQSGAEYVDTLVHFSQHEPCATGGEWIRFVGTSGPRDGWFHPTRTGQGMFARIVSCYMDVYPKRNSPHDEPAAARMTACVADHYPTVIPGILEPTSASMGSVR